MNDPVKVLIDTCLFRIAPAEQLVLEYRDGVKPSLWGPNNSFVGIATRSEPKIPINEVWKRAQSDAMRSIGQLARDGRIRLFSYTELEFENLHGSRSPLHLAYDSLAGVTVEYVPAALERYKFQKIPMEEFCDKKTRIDFYGWLLTLDHNEVFRRPRFRSTFSDCELRNLESLGRFREICKGLEREHYPDAFHLWTAEVNQLDFFLTADKTFTRAITETTRVVKSTQSIFPCDLLKVNGSLR